ncbi:hypothetical protein KCMC57_up10940 [Kitasatospora sp. CMC57]|uniref:Glycosyltransferase n=1 Tax=Kitasatospora sp. CMC57 TaxID=3231513 RepID=A0AB33JPW5_9ACTN
MSTPLPANVLRHPTRDGDPPLRRATDRPTAARPRRRLGDGTRTRHSVSVVVPARSEARNIPWGFTEIPHCVDKVICRSFLGQLDLRSAGFEIEAEMIAHALRSGLRIAEVPSLELPRRGGRSHLHAVPDGRRVLRTLISERPGGSGTARRVTGEW